jgi:transposase
MVMIGIDPHKRTHTAVAVNEHEDVISEQLVHASTRQARELVGWARRFDSHRIWAIESAGGLGYLLAQQLLAAGELVVDIPATLAARARVLDTGRSAKNDPNDARSVAVAALRARELVPVRREDHATVLRLLSTRHRQLGHAHNKMACRAHALIADLVAGGIGKELVVGQALRALETVQPASAAEAQRLDLALELLDDVDRLNDQRRESKRRIAAAVAASGTTVTEIFGVGDVVAATLIGRSGDIARFATADRFAAYNGTAPIEHSSGNPTRPVHRLSRRGDRVMNHALHVAAITQIRFAHSPGRGFYDRKLNEGKTPKAAIRALKRRLSDTVYRHLTADARRARRG